MRNATLLELGSERLAGSEESAKGGGDGGTPDMWVSCCDQLHLSDPI